MAANTLHVALPDPLKAFVEERITEGEFGTPSDYIRSLIREDRERRRERLELQLLEALESSSIEVRSEELNGKSLVAVLRKKLISDAS